MSPYYFNGANAGVFSVGGATYPGYLDWSGVTYSNAVRPVISLKSDNLKSEIITDYDEDYKQMLIKRFNDAKKLFN